MDRHYRWMLADFGDAFSLGSALVLVDIPSGGAVFRWHLDDRVRGGVVQPVHLMGHLTDREAAKVVEADFMVGALEPVRRRLRNRHAVLGVDGRVVLPYIVPRTGSEDEFVSELIARAERIEELREARFAALRRSAAGDSLARTYGALDSVFDVVTAR